VNPYDNFQFKLDYYMNAYDDDLKLKANSAIEIIGWSDYSVEYLSI